MEKQIEEMAKDLCHLSKEYGECSTCDAVIDIGDKPCVYRCVAEMILDNGYRKASDVVMEIFADIKNIWEQGRGFIKYTDLVDLERIYEEKYESEDGE